MNIRLFGQIVPLPALVGLGIIAVNLVAALFAPIIAPFAEADVVGDAWAEADWTYLLGLDNLPKVLAEGFFDFAFELFEREVLAGGRVGQG